MSEQIQALYSVLNIRLARVSAIGIFMVALLFLPTVLWASDVEKWSEGACWISKSQMNNDEDSVSLYSLASFNDQVATQFTSFQLESVLLEKNKTKNRFNKSHFTSQIVNFHCGAYGHSVILTMKSTDEDGPGYCAWMYFKDGEWLIRSFGGLHGNEEPSKKCHGFKRGNLVLYVKPGNDQQTVRDHLQKEFDREILAIHKIGQSALKVELKEDFLDLEKSVRERMTKHSLVGPLIDVDFNWYSHSVGEFKE